MWKVSVLIAFFTFNGIDAYPCSGNIIIAYDRSNETTSDGYKKQVAFLRDKVFTNRWTKFEELALVSYADEANVTNYGELKSLTDIHNFFEEDRIPAKPSLAGAFNQILDANLTDPNKPSHAIIFVSTMTKLIARNDVFSYRRKLAKNNCIITYIFMWMDGRHHSQNWLLPNVIMWNISRHEVAPPGFENRLWSAYGCDTSFNIWNNWPQCMQVFEEIQSSNCNLEWIDPIMLTIRTRQCIRGKTTPRLSIQDLICNCPDCLNDITDVCKGGDVDTVIRYASQNGIRTCEKSGECPEDCQSLKRLNTTARIYTINRRRLSTQDEIMKEIQSNGPVIARFTLYSDFLLTEGDVYIHFFNDDSLGHAYASIVGWGVSDEGQPYWMAAYHVGRGDDGFFKILRGSNEAGFEDDVFAVDVKLVEPTKATISAHTHF